jgi:hypothetical protein
MKRFTFILFMCFSSLLSAQRHTNGVSLTQEEIDSFRTGKASKYLQDRIERNFKAAQAYRDSIIRTKILNQPIADFDARDTSGLVHRPSMYRGRVWIAYFWEFWENPFQYELPSLNTVVDSLRGEGVEVVSFLNARLGESEKKYLVDRPINFPIIENSEKFGDAFLGMSFQRPVVCIIDKKGVCRYFYDARTLQFGFKFEHKNELLDENKPKMPSYDFLEKVKSLLLE